MRLGLLSLLLLSICSFGIKDAAAQPCSSQITGRVIDVEGRALPGATVRLLADSRVVTTDETGEFLIGNICFGMHRLQVSYIGFDSSVVSVNVPGKSLDIRLSPSTTDLENVVIEGTQSAKRMASQTVSELQKEQLLQLHGRPLGESLKEIPGVSAIQTGPAIFKPVIHGLHSQRILILNNGIRQEGQQWGAEHAPEVDPFIASSLEVIKGAETVRYGADAIGGVVIINPPPLHEVKGLGGEFNSGFMSNNRMGVLSGMLEGNFGANGPWRWRVQSSAKRGGDFHAADYNLSNTGTKEINFSGAAGFEKERSGLELYVSSFNSEIAILRAAHSGNQNDFAESLDREQPWYIRDFTYDINNPYQQIGHHLLKARSHFQWNDRAQISILYGGQYNQRREYDIRRAGRSSTPAISMNLMSHVLDLSVDHKERQHSGSFGINGTYKRNQNDTETTGINPLIPDYEQFSAAAFVLEKWNKGKWTFDAGGRYDFQQLKVLTFDQQQLIKPSFNFNFFSGTLGASYVLSTRARIVTNFGIASRPPHVSELYSQGLHHSAGSIEEGTMRKDGAVLVDQQLIRKENSRKLTSTLQILRDHFSLDFSIYGNSISNYVYLRPTGLRTTIQGYFPVFTYDQTDVILLGSDLSMNWRINESFTWEAKYSYLYAKDVTHDSPLISMPPAQVDNSVTYRFKEVSWLHDFYVNLSAPYTFRQFNAPRVVHPSNLESDTSDEVFDFMAAPEGYWLLNARIGFQLPVRDRHINVVLSSENMLNTSYRNYMNRWRYFADDTGRNFIIRLSYNFYKH